MKMTMFTSTGESSTDAKIKLIDAPSLESVMRSDDVPWCLLDVRERGQYALGHIPGATTLARGLLELRIAHIVPNRRSEVIVCCDDGYRSNLAARTLVDLGYRDVSVLEGGVDRWSQSGRVLDTGTNVRGKEYGEAVAVRRAVRQITPDTLAALQASDDVHVLDVRTAREYSYGHIPGARSVPGSELPIAALSLMGSDQYSGTIVVNCAGRTRSILAADLLNRMGFRNVVALENGTMAWLMSGRKLDCGPPDAEVPHDSESSRVGAERFAQDLVDAAGIPPVSPQEVLSLAHADDGPACYILDVRLESEYADAHIPGALSCPVGQLANVGDELIGVKNGVIICYSNDATRARIAAFILREIGYPHAVWLRGGLRAMEHEVELASGDHPTGGTGCAADPTTARAPKVGAAEVSRLMDTLKPIHLIDVRRSSEFAGGHIDGSVWIPRGDIERRIRDAVPDVNDTIVVVSQRGVRAGWAAATLEDLGYGQVLYLAGGLTAWDESVRPVSEGLEGADVSLLEAKEDLDLVVRAPAVLKRSRDDMERYLEWEVTLGEKFAE